jgi:putative endonuclease
VYHLYIIECDNGSFYTGITTDIKRRFSEHASGKGAGYTRGRKPKKIVYTEECGTRSEALRRECAIKKLSRSEKIELVENQSAMIKKGNIVLAKIKIEK